MNMSSTSNNHHQLLVDPRCRTKEEEQREAAATICEQASNTTITCPCYNKPNQYSNHHHHHHQMPKTSILTTKPDAGHHISKTMQKRTQTNREKHKRCVRSYRSYTFLHHRTSSSCKLNLNHRAIKFMLIIAISATLIILLQTSKCLTDAYQDDHHHHPSLDDEIAAEEASAPFVDLARQRLPAASISTSSIIETSSSSISVPRIQEHSELLISSETSSSSSSSSSFDLPSPTFSALTPTSADSLRPPPTILATSESQLHHNHHQLLKPQQQQPPTSNHQVEPLAGVDSTDNGNFLPSPSLTSDDQTASDINDSKQDAILFNQPFDYHSNMPVITKRELANAIKQATGNVRRLRDSMEPNMLSVTSSNNRIQQQQPAIGSTSWMASSMFHKPGSALDGELMNQTNQALISEETTRILTKQYKLNRLQTLRGLPLISVDQTNLGKLCPRSTRTFNCVAGRYRSLSGHCNNVQNPDWAAAQTPLVRYAPARYADQVSRPIKSSRAPLNNQLSAAQQQQQQQNSLPSARQVSGAIYEASSATTLNSTLPTTQDNQQQQQQHSHMTTLMSFFGQFFFHDLVYVSQYTPLPAASPVVPEPPGSGNTGGGQINNNVRGLIKCCDVAPANQHPECMPIELRAGAGGGQNNNNYCLDYVRSTPAIRPGCNLGARDQLNQVSSYLDGSAIYGSSEQQMLRLRAFTGGRLRSQRVPVQLQVAGGGGASSSSASSSGSPSPSYLELLPAIKLSNHNSSSSSASLSQSAHLHQQRRSLDALWAAAAEDCRQMAAARKLSSNNNINKNLRSPSSNNNVESVAAEGRCFQAGDERVNENIGLALMHTIWMREHNLIADKLAQLNKHWRDERLFQEARRLVVAQLQHIAYNEFLTSILGEEVMQRFNLSSLTQGYSQNYDPQLNAGLSNELATAVLPFILTTIPNTLERYSDRLEVMGETSLSETFMDGSHLFKRNMFAQYLMGMISQNALEPALALMPAMSMDTSSAATPTSGRQKRQVGGAGGGQQTLQQPPQLDIVALTIQQGRDHGLKPYLYWREACQLKPEIGSWQELAQVMPANVVERLRRVYSNIQQLDLYLALLENPLPGSSVGPTFVCLLARQFYQLKHGDRYWYENDLPGSSFSPKQLEQIRQTSLAKVLCRNSQATLSFVQPMPMITSDPYLNAYQYCTNKAMAQLDLSKWREPIQSAKQLTDELLLSGLSAASDPNGGGDLEPSESSLARGRKLIETNSRLIAESLQRAKRDLDSLAYKEIVAQRRWQREKRSLAMSRSVGGGGGEETAASAARGYRYLPRTKRQTLKINNQSLIFELATNEVVRSLLHQGKDRERGQSIQSDIRDFLQSLEAIQLDNLLDSSSESGRLFEFISGAGGQFLTPEQRLQLSQAGDTSLQLNPALDSVGPPTTSSIGGGGGGAGGSASTPERTSSLSDNCQDNDRAYPCDHTTPFRTITGWCNNLDQPKWGQSFTAHDRLLPNAYSDSFSKPRQYSVLSPPGGATRSAPSSSSSSSSLVKLPSARLISTTIHDNTSRLHVRYSLALMQFGQFGVDHDLTRTPFAVALDGSLLDCSSCDSTQTVHRDCLPIEIPSNDAHFHSTRANELTGTNKKCLHFVRSLNGQTGLGPRQQINALTAYIDASNIYGSDNCEAKSLRSFIGGRLNSSVYPVQAQFPNIKPREILPVTRANPECVTPSGICFHAGDQRASEQPGLTSIHTVFMRLHNSVVNQLAQVNRHWNDEKLYQHGRRIVGAIMQRITYNEFAPRLLGLDYMSKFDLILKPVGYSDDYDDSCSANILTEFAAAAFRMGHSLIRNAFPLLNKQYKPIGKAFQLRKAFFNSQRILTEPTLIDSILRGIVSTPIETLDNTVTDELTNHLFEKPKEPFSGMDLISLNIQRARDHGIGGYNKYRAKCNLTRAKTFDDLMGEIPAKIVRKLSNLYAHVDDIDLFTGGLSELPVHGGIIGPTLGCIIGMQFSRLKRCDRFWHETSNPWVRFSAPQLAEIRKMTLAKVICQESDNIDSIQRNAMDIPDQYLNPKVSCASLPSMDFIVWRENLKSCLINKVKVDLGQTRRINPCRSCTCTMEGPVCRTVKINCLQAMKQQANSLSSIMSDKSCLVQCAWALDMQTLPTST